MRVLLDECLPRPLRRELPGHEVRTVHEMGWTSVANGALLRLAERRFDAFLTVDRGIPHENPIAGLGIAVIVLHGAGTRVDQLLPLLPEVRALLLAIRPGEVRHVGP